MKYFYKKTYTTLCEKINEKCAYDYKVQRELVVKLNIMQDLLTRSNVF